MLRVTFQSDPSPRLLAEAHMQLIDDRLKSLNLTPQQEFVLLHAILEQLENDLM